jgi:hypothetical protein
MDRGGAGRRDAGEPQRQRPRARQRAHRAALAQRESRGGLLNDYADGPEAGRALGRYFEFYNHARPQQALAWRTPFEVIKACPKNGSGEEALTFGCRPSFDSKVLT